MKNADVSDITIFNKIIWGRQAFLAEPYLWVGRGVINILIDKN